MSEFIITIFTIRINEKCLYLLKHFYLYALIIVQTNSYDRNIMQNNKHRRGTAGSTYRQFFN